jgi:hypothetical protein
MGKIAFNVPKISLKKFDWSKLNLRKLNWVTVAALLAYFNILLLIPLFCCKKSKFIQFHVRQGIALLVVTVLFFFSFFVTFLPIILGLFIVVCFIIGIINVITGHERYLPLIGKLAK